MPTSLPITNEQATLNALADMPLLSPGQIEKIEDEIAQSERALRGLSMHEGEEAMPMALDPRYPVADPEIQRGSIRRDRETLAKGSPPELTPRQQNILYGYVKKWAEEIREGMPSHDQMQRDTWEHIALHTAHESRNLRKELAWMRGLRTLDRGREDITIEILRPATAAPVNYQNYLKGIELVEWTEDQDLERELEELTDDTYHAFLTYHAVAPSSPKLVMQRAGLTQAQYEACKRRWRDEVADLALADAADASPPAPEEVAPATPDPAPVPAESDELLTLPPITAEDVARACTYFDELAATGDTITNWGKVGMKLNMSVERARRIHEFYTQKTASSAA